MIETTETGDIVDHGDEDDSGASDLSVSELLVPETTLQEGSADVLREVGECSPPSLADAERAVVEFPCPECDRTFDLKIKLNRHMKLHTKKTDAKAMLFTTPVMKVKCEPGTSTPRGPGNRGTPRNYQPPPEGEGVACPECVPERRFKSRAAMQRHFEDIHQPGEFPCRGCGKVFTSKNKQSSHYSRNCKQRHLQSLQA